MLVGRQERWREVGKKDRLQSTLPITPPAQRLSFGGGAVTRRTCPPAAPRPPIGEPSCRASQPCRGPLFSTPLRLCTLLKVMHHDLPTCFSPSRGEATEAATVMASVGAKPFWLFADHFLAFDLPWCFQYSALFLGPCPAIVLRGLRLLATTSRAVHPAGASMSS